MRFRTLALCALVAGLVGVGCGDGTTSGEDGGVDGSQADAGARDAARPARCGNASVEEPEECDDGNTDDDDGCASDCTSECGNGTVNTGELCDPGIVSGDGACPSDCDDGDACTTDALTGADCAVECVHGDITTPAAGDGCCPPGADSTTDTDCSATCGNMIVETGEACDTGIASGAGACPTGCDDSNACTTDTLTGAACSAACANVDITEIGPTDGCCPAGGTTAADPDCAGCGDGSVVAPETCDTAISSGAGSCPTAASCNDGIACTADSIAAAGTCVATCSNTPIAASTGPTDGCCPTGATIGTDTDCAARCGDGVTTAPETCDDGNTSASDGCSATCTTETVALTAFRMTDLDLMDPHPFAMVPFLGCADVTNLSVLGNDGINPLLQNNIQNDEDGDGFLDLSLVQVFAPLVQAAGTTTPGYLVFPDCTAPMSSTMCTLAAGEPRTAATTMNRGAGMTCLEVLSGTARPYSPAIVPSAAPTGGTCYVASAGTITIDLGGIPIMLEDAQIAGEWSGNPATQILDGLVRGFMSRTQADATLIPEGTTGIASIDGEPLSSLLRGGPGNCNAAHPMPGDRDLQVGTSIEGWYFYLNFRANRVPYTEL